MYDDLNNMYGPLPPDILERLRAYDGTEAKWDDVHGIILRADRGFGFGLTVWQAVGKVDPTFPMTGPSEDGTGRRLGRWARVPSVHTFARAIRYARMATGRKVS